MVSKKHFQEEKIKQNNNFHCSSIKKHSTNSCFVRRYVENTDAQQQI